MSAINTPRLSVIKNAPTKTENEQAGGDGWEEENGSSAPLPCYQPAHPGLVLGLSSPFSPRFPFLESFRPGSGSPRRAAGDGDSAQAPLGATCSGRKVLPAGPGTSVSFATSSSGLCPADSPAGPLPGLKQSRRRQHTNKFQCFRGAEVGGGTSGRDAGPKGPLSYEDTNRV